MSLRMGKSWSLGALAVLACSAGFEANGEGDFENVARTSDRVVLSSNANCTVEMTKLDYDQVGADSNDYIELKVTKKAGGSATTLIDCGIGALALYDEPSVVGLGVCVPYSLTPLLNVTIPADGYIEIGQAAGSTVPATVAPGSGADGWIHNDRGEIAFLSGALAASTPTSWFQFEGAAKCNLTSLPVTAVSTESDTSPNFTNVSCDSTFHLVNAANALPKSNADCPSGGAGGGGNAGGGAGVSSGGTAGLAGIGGLLNLGGSLNLGGTAGGLAAGGAGGLVNLGGSAGTLNLAGNAGVGNGSGSSGAGGDTSVGGDAGTSFGGASGSSATAGDAGEAGEPNSAQGGKVDVAGGSSSGANAGKAGSSEIAGDGGRQGHGVVTQGGGCACSVPNGPTEGRTPALLGLVALLGLYARRRYQSPNRSPR